MKEKYVPPVMEKIEFDYTETITASNGPAVTKNPGNHLNCTVMPNGKPIPENAEGYWKNH